MAEAWNVKEKHTHRAVVMWDADSKAVRMKLSKSLVLISHHCVPNTRNTGPSTLIPPVVCRKAPFPTLSPAFVVACFLDDSHSKWMKHKPNIVLTFLWLRILDFFIYLYIFWEMSLNLFVHLMFALLGKGRDFTSLYIMNNRPVWYTYSTRLFSSGWSFPLLCRGF